MFKHVTKRACIDRLVFDLVFHLLTENFSFVAKIKESNNRNERKNLYSAEHNLRLTFAWNQATELPFWCRSFEVKCAWSFLMFCRNDAKYATIWHLLTKFVTVWDFSFLLERLDCNSIRCKIYLSSWENFPSSHFPDSEKVIWGDLELLRKLNCTQK